jgi:hypothetical protein
MIPRLVITVKICGWLMLTTRMAIASTPVITVGMTGVFVLGEILASFSPAGKRLSRAIANIIRIAADCTARVHTVMAMTTAHRKILPTVPPNTSSTMNCRPPVEISGLLMSPTAIRAKSRISPPITNDAMSARRIALGALRRGSRDSSPSELAVSKPYIT